MAAEKVKMYLKSKTFWGAILVVTAGISAALGYTGFATTIGSLGGALGLIGVRNAEGKLVWKE